MKVFIKGLKEVQGRIPASLHNYLVDCDESDAIEVLEIELGREYIKDLDWLYSTLPSRRRE